MWNTKSICLFLLGFIGVGTVEGQTSVDSYEYSSYVDPRIGSEGLDGMDASGHFATTFLKIVCFYYKMRE